MPVRSLPKPLLASILGFLSLALITLPVASYAAPIARAASSPNSDDANAEDTGPSSVDMHAPGVKSATTAAEMLARAESPREVRALRQLGVRLQQPCQEAKAEAQDNINGTVWAVGGCLASITALGAATFLEPDPPSSALMGKSDKYVAEYTDCYKEAGVNKRQKYALYGCLGNVVAIGAFYAIYAAALTSSY